jgi:hypothetical protein
LTQSCVTYGAFEFTHYLISAIVTHSHLVSILLLPQIVQEALDWQMHLAKVAALCNKQICLGRSRVIAAAAESG